MRKGHKGSITTKASCLLNCDTVMKNIWTCTCTLGTICASLEDLTSHLISIMLSIWSEIFFDTPSSSCLQQHETRCQNYCVPWLHGDAHYGIVSLQSNKLPYWVRIKTSRTWVHIVHNERLDCNIPFSWRGITQCKICLRVITRQRKEVKDKKHLMQTVHHLYLVLLLKLHFPYYTSKLQICQIFFWLQKFLYKHPH